MLASCGYDLDVNIWNMNTHKLRNNYRVRLDHPYTVTYIVLFTCTVHAHKGHEDWIQDIHFGENNRWLVSCTKVCNPKIKIIHKLSCRIIIISVIV